MMDSGENSPVTLVCDVNVELTQWCFKEKKDVSSALETVFESCRSKGNAKVIFNVTKNEDVDKLLQLMEEMQRRIIYGDGIPRYVLQDIQDKGQYADIITSFWPQNWFTNITYTSHIKDDMLPNIAKVYSLPNIQGLKLCWNDAGVPLLNNYIGTLKNLRSFSINGCLKPELPPTLRCCKELEELDFSSNRLRYLPFWITKLKNLRCLKRLGNPLEYLAKPHTLIETGRRRKDQEEIDDKCWKKELKSPISLFLISASVVLVEYPHLALQDGKKSNELPRSLFANLALLSSTVNFCDNCNQAFFNDEYPIVRKTFKDFNGYKNIPFEATCCSDLCADKIAEEWRLISNCEDTDEDDNLCFDVPGSSESLERVWNHRQRRLRRDKISNMFRSIFCCCS